MKKLKYVCLLFVCYFVCIFNVHCESYKCEYSFSGETSGPTWILEFNTSKGTIKNHSERERERKRNKFDTLMIYWYYYYSYEFIEEEIKTYETNVCPILYLVNYVEDFGDHKDSYYTLYSNDFIREKDNGNKCITNKDPFCWSDFVGTFNYYYTGTLTDSDINANNTMESVCGSYDTVYMNLRKAYELYYECKENGTCENEMGKIKSIENNIKTLCSGLLEHSDYIIEGDNGEKYESSCINKCLKLSDDINKLKNKVPLRQTCGISERLAIWIGNIIRWVKYIIPSVVIIFGILDFIKALGADKEDEMKKAQKKFIRRLIAAALIFIAPFIIEFILDKMGFSSNGCGIIDL